MDKESNEYIQSSEEESLIFTEQDVTNLDELWDQLNLTPEQKQIEREKLQMRLKQETKTIIEKEFRLKDEINNEIRDMKIKEIKFLKALGKKEKEIHEVSKLGISGTLIERLNEVKSSYDKVLPSYVERVKLFNEIWNKINTLFDKIGYDASSRGEFAKFDNDDLSEEKEIIFKNKYASLEDEYNERVKSIEEIDSNLQKISTEIGEEISPTIDQLLKSKQVNTVAYTSILDYYEEFSSLKDERAKKVSALALEIIHCWDLLKVPEEDRKEFINSHSQLSSQNINDLEAKLDELHSEIESNLTEMIAEIKGEITETCRNLHFTDEEIENQLVEKQDEKSTFYNYEKNLIDLKKLASSSQTLIQMIKEREEIINQYEAIKDSKSESKGEQKVDSATEKIKRRYKTYLPRLDKKISIELIKFKEINSRPFTWDGNNYEDNLQHVKLSISEVNQAKSQAHKVIRKQKKSM